MNFSLLSPSYFTSVLSSCSPTPSSLSFLTPLGNTHWEHASGQQEAEQWAVDKGQVKSLSLSDSLSLAFRGHWFWFLVCLSCSHLRTQFSIFIIHSLLLTKVRQVATNEIVSEIWGVGWPVWFKTTLRNCHNITVKPCGKKHIGISSARCHPCDLGQATPRFTSQQCRLQAETEGDCPAHCLVVSASLLLPQPNIWGWTP